VQTNAEASLNVCVGRQTDTGHIHGEQRWTAFDVGLVAVARDVGYLPF